MTPEPLLEVDRLSVSYGRVRALEDVSLVVNEGELVVVLGANGAGKSTLLNAVAGVVPARSGTITFAGEPRKGRPDRMLGRGLVLVLQGHPVFPDLTVEDNLALGGYGLGRHDVRTRLAALFERFPMLAAFRDRRAGALSGGQQQILCIARALVAEPRMLMLDEPSLGLDPLHAGMVYQAIAEARSAGTTILLVEQIVGRALEVGDRAYVLDAGSVVMDGAVSKLRDEPELAKAYLGVEAV